MASASADAVWCSTRIRRVSRPLTRTQALNGLSEGPVCRIIVCTGPSMNSWVPRTAPPSVRPCPSMCLVAEYTTTSAPNSSGRCSTGVANTLSTTTCAPAACARSQTARTSMSSCIGLDGDSKNTAVAGVLSASRHWSRSCPSTKSVCTPNRGRISSRITKHEPNRLRAATTRSPAETSAAIATQTAAMPLAVA